MRTHLIHRPARDTIPPFDSDPFVREYLSAFLQRLHELGWIEGRNIRPDYRFTGQDAERMRAGSAELIAFGPDVIVVWANPAAAIVRKATENYPDRIRCRVRSGGRRLRHEFRPSRRLSCSRWRKLDKAQPGS